MRLPELQRSGAFIRVAAALGITFPFNLAFGIPQ